MQDMRTLFELASHGPDTYVGAGRQYPWGGLYGGHIVAQALRAATLTVDDGSPAHSLRAYFIRRGDNSEPIRYEVDRIRNGRSFTTRRVVARQSNGAILNLEASFHRGERSRDTTFVTCPEGIPGPLEFPKDSWTAAFDRRMVPQDRVPTPPIGAGRTLVWTRVDDDLGDETWLHQCALAYISDDFPADSVRSTFPPELRDHQPFVASLDHTIWFHRPARADDWLLYDMVCHSYVAARGLVVGQVYSSSGVHVATVAQEVLMRAAEPEAPAS